MCKCVRLAGKSSSTFVLNYRWLYKMTSDKHDQQNTQPLLSQFSHPEKKQRGRGRGRLCQILADKRGAYSKGALIRGEAFIRGFTVTVLRLALKIIKTNMAVFLCNDVFLTSYVLRYTSWQVHDQPRFQALSPFPGIEVGTWRRNNKRGKHGPSRALNNRLQEGFARIKLFIAV